MKSALAQLQTTRDRIDISIVDEGRKGLFGFIGSRPAIVKAAMKPDVTEYAEKFLHTVISNMGIEAEIEAVPLDSRNVEFRISGEKMGLLIGKRGMTVNSLQYLVQLAVNRQSDRFLNIILNPENYRERRKDTLIQLAGRLADKACRRNEAVKLESMPAYERKIIHSALAGNRSVVTSSEGEEPNRYVVIKPK